MSDIKTAIKQSFLCYNGIGIKEIPFYATEKSRRCFFLGWMQRIFKDRRDMQYDLMVNWQGQTMMRIKV